MMKRADLQAAQKDIKTALYKPQHEIALDYIYHNNTDNPNEYDMMLQRNAAKVKFKNAIMQVWTQVKKELQPKNIKQLVEEMLQKQLRKQELLGLTKKEQVEEDKSEQEQLVEDSKSSYFTLEQYHSLTKRLSDAHYRMKE